MLFACRLACRAHITAFTTKWSDIYSHLHIRTTLNSSGEQRAAQQGACVHSVNSSTLPRCIHSMIDPSLKQQPFAGTLTCRSLTDASFNSPWPPPRPSGEVKPGLLSRPGLLVGGGVRRRNISCTLRRGSGNKYM
jgi:hypothetical protein